MLSSVIDEAVEAEGKGLHCQLRFESRIPHLEVDGHVGVVERPHDAGAEETKADGECLPVVQIEVHDRHPVSCTACAEWRRRMAAPNGWAERRRCTPALYSGWAGLPSGGHDWR